MDRQTAQQQQEVCRKVSMSVLQIWLAVKLILFFSSMSLGFSVSQAINDAVNAAVEVVITVLPYFTLCLS